MIIPIFTRAVLVGLVAALPAGPISVLCIKKSLTDRLLAGLAIALGAATGDGIFAFWAAVGMTNIGAFLLAHLTALRITASIVLALLGIKSLWYASSATITHPTSRSIIEGYLTALFLTLTNPLTFVTFAAAFAAVGLGDATRNAPHIALGVIIGSFSWFSSLAIAASFLRNQCSISALVTIQRVAGTLLIVCALGVLMSIAAI